MIRTLAAAAALLAAVSIGGCTAYTPDQAAAAAQSDQHTTAETGFGLGPETYKTNGGAFGPDQGSP